MLLYGKRLKRRDIEARIGTLDQIGGIKRFSFVEGIESSVEQIQVRTGSGLTYYVSPTRGMDITYAEFGGVPISWQSPNGVVHPSFYDARNSEWARTAVGGLLMTCGLTQVGSPCNDNGVLLGQHGRIHHTPASSVSTEGTWKDDEYEMCIKGMVHESSIFGENLLLKREITSSMGKNHIAIHDTVENLGFDPSPHMILYHFNFGYPLMTDKTKIIFPSKDVEPREPDLPLENLDHWRQPENGFSERVYYHKNLSLTWNPKTHKEQAVVVIANSEFPYVNGTKSPLQVKLSWNVNNLPNLIEWYMPGKGINALGIEPSNCRVEGRVSERKRGTLVMLEPGDSLEYELELEIC